MNFTRRDIGKLALAALPAARIWAAKPNSVFGGVQVGINAPYSFHNIPGSADDILEYMTQLNISAAELRLQPVEAYLKAPAPWVAPRTAGRGAGRTPLTPEQKAEQAAVAQAQEKWRLSQSMDGFKAFRKKYEDAGVLIQIVKYDGINTFKDDVVDYCFQVAKALGAYAISCEIPVSQTERLGAFAAKHKMMVGYHGHGNLTDPEAFGRLGSVGAGFHLFQVQRRQRGHRALFRGYRNFSGGVDQGASRPRHPRSHQGSQGQQRAQHALRPGRHADQRNPPR